MTTAGPSPSCAMTLRSVAVSRSVSTLSRTASSPAPSSAPTASSVTETTGMSIPAGSMRVGRKISPGPRPG